MSETEETEETEETDGFEDIEMVECETTEPGERVASLLAIIARELRLLRRANERGAETSRRLMEHVTARDVRYEKADAVRRERDEIAWARTLDAWKKQDERDSLAGKLEGEITKLKRDLSKTIEKEIEELGKR